MGFWKDDPEPATVREKPFRCVVCNHDTFYTRRAQLHGALLSFLDLEWAAPNCDLLICSECGYVHWFLQN